MKIGKLEIKKALHRYAKLRQQSVENAMENTKFPKNLIIFIGDGMSISTVTAARILKNQKMENISDVDEEQELTWENFPEMALMKVLMYMIYFKIVHRLTKAQCSALVIRPSINSAGL